MWTLIWSLRVRPHLTHARPAAAGCLNLTGMREKASLSPLTRATYRLSSECDQWPLWHIYNIPTVIQGCSCSRYQQGHLILQSAAGTGTERQRAWLDQVNHGQNLNGPVWDPRCLTIPPQLLFVILYGGWNPGSLESRSRVM